jgi:hypothetical protein
MRRTAAAAGVPGSAGLILAWLLLASGWAFAQTQAPAPAPAPTRTPAPYTQDEFPRWLRDLRRAEVIFIGSIPFTMFFTFEGYDTYRYVANGLDPFYAPWPFRPGSAQLYTTQEKTGILVSALSLSLVIAAADYVVGRIHERAARR